MLAQKGNVQTYAKISCTFSPFLCEYFQSLIEMFQSNLLKPIPKRKCLLQKYNDSCIDQMQSLTISEFCHLKSDIFAGKGNFKVRGVGQRCPFKADHRVLLQNGLRSIGPHTCWCSILKCTHFGSILIHGIAFWGLVQRLSGKVSELKWKWWKLP